MKNIEKFEHLWKEYLRVQHAIKDAIDKGGLEGKEIAALLRVEADAIKRELFSPKNLELNAKAYDQKAKERQGQIFEKAHKVRAARVKTTRPHTRTHVRPKTSVKNKLLQLVHLFGGKQRTA